MVRREFCKPITRGIAAVFGVHNARGDHWRNFFSPVRARVARPSVPFKWSETNIKPHARTIEFLTQALALGVRVRLGPYDITHICRDMLDRIAKDLSHA